VPNKNGAPARAGQMVIIELVKKVQLWQGTGNFLHDCSRARLFNLRVIAVTGNGFHFEITPSHFGEERLVCVLRQRPQDGRTGLV
jgi:hypothetical protein